MVAAIEALIAIQSGPWMQRPGDGKTAAFRAVGLKTQPSGCYDALQNAPLQRRGYSRSILVIPRAYLQLLLIHTLWR